MQSLTCNRTTLIWPGTILIGRVLLIGWLVLLTQIMRVEAAPFYASPCTLVWNPRQDPSVNGYCLYFGIEASATTNRMDVGMTNLVTLKNLIATSNYFFYVVSYNSSGEESPASTMVYYTPPALSGLNLTRSTNNGTMSLHFLTATGASCHVEFTPTLNPPQWQAVGGATADANGSVTISDPTSGNLPARFYRVARP